jgi:hypothetical protein
MSIIQETQISNQRGKFLAETPRWFFKNQPKQLITNQCIEP